MSKTLFLVPVGKLFLVPVVSSMICIKQTNKPKPNNQKPQTKAKPETQTNLFHFLWVFHTTAFSNVHFCGVHTARLQRDDNCITPFFTIRVLLYLSKIYY